MNDLIEIFDKAKRKNWCTKFMCTTCGSEEFRNAVNDLSEEKIYQCLKMLTYDEIMYNKDALEVIYNDLKIAPTGLDVLMKVEGAPVHDYFKEIFTFIKNWKPKSYCD